MPDRNGEALLARVGDELGHLSGHRSLRRDVIQEHAAGDRSDALLAGCLGAGYWLVYRSRKIACAGDEACSRQLPNRVVITGLLLASILVAGALAFDFLAPLVL